MWLGEADDIDLQHRRRGVSEPTWEKEKEGARRLRKLNAKLSEKLIATLKRQNHKASSMVVG